METDPPTNPKRGPRDSIAFACQECGRAIRFPYASRGRVEVCPYCDEYVDVPDPSRDSGAATVASCASDSSRCGEGCRADRHDAQSCDDEHACTGDRGESAACRGAAVSAAGATLHEEAPYPSTRRLRLEVLAVMCLAVLPPLAGAIGHAAGWTPSATSFYFNHVWLVVANLEVAVPLLLIVALSGEPWARFGIVRFSWLWDVLVGVVLWSCSVVVHVILVEYFPHEAFSDIQANIPPPLARPEGVLSALLVLVSSATTGFAEEFTMRGYLLPKLERLFHSTGLAIVATTVLFAAFHAYQGPFGVASAAANGLLFGAAFCLMRRLWPIAIAHAMLNVAAILLR